MKTFKIILAATALLALTACGNKKPSENWLTSDDVSVAIDETFRPIMQEEAETFALKHPEAAMFPYFCSEDSAIRMLVNDSVRLCVATRRLTDRELDIVSSHTLKALHSQIATDAFALIVNKNNSDSLITLPEIKKIVSGEITRWEQLSHSSRKGELKLVFDNSGSSTVRFMRDSLCNGKELSGNLFAQGSNLAVIDAVRENPDIIGVVGTNWLKGKEDSVLTSFRNLDINVMKVSRIGGNGEFFCRPFQYYIATGEYPLLRSVYVICTDPRSTSMTKNFYFFLKGQRGQLIICNNSQMLPRTQVQVRDVSISD